MAEELGIVIGTVKSRLHTAVKRFGKEWEHRKKEAALESETYASQQEVA